LSSAFLTRRVVPATLGVLLGVLACAAAVGCAPRSTGAEVGGALPRSSAVAFSYARVDGQGFLTDEALRGRVSVIAFMTTYDLGSQAEARFVSAVMRRHVPRINAAAVILEPLVNAPLVRAFAETLDLPYPLAWADAETIAGRGPFGDVHTVPTTVVLDREGRRSWKGVGLVKEDELSAVLDRL
jgi:hypothetical protein